MEDQFQCSHSAWYQDVSGRGGDTPTQHKEDIDNNIETEGAARNMGG